MINFRRNYICCLGKLIDFSIPKIMGILNITLDSFYDGGKYVSKTKVINHVKNMIKEGADIIDIGACSTRPGSIAIPINEEINIIDFYTKLIVKNFPNIILSIDTFRSEVAKIAIENGVSIINDISGGTLDKKMFKMVSKLNVPYILTHINGNPFNMQKKTNYNNLIIDINNFFSKKISKLKSLGVNDIILDPGFGFGKKNKDNIYIVKHLDLIGFKHLPILLGVSRKSTIQSILNVSSNNSLNGTSVIHTLALLKKFTVSILRVHDVKESYECIKLLNYYNSI